MCEDSPPPPHFVRSAPDRRQYFVSRNQNIFVERCFKIVFEAVLLLKTQARAILFYGNTFRITFELRIVDQNITTANSICNDIRSKCSNIRNASFRSRMNVKKKKNYNYTAVDEIRIHSSNFSNQRAAMTTCGALFYWRHFNVSYLIKTAIDWACPSRKTVMRANTPKTQRLPFVTVPLITARFSTFRFNLF